MLIFSQIEAFENEIDDSPSNTTQIPNNIDVNPSISNTAQPKNEQIPLSIPFNQQFQPLENQKFKTTQHPTEEEGHKLLKQDQQKPIEKQEIKRTRKEVESNVNVSQDVSSKLVTPKNQKLSNNHYVSTTANSSAGIILSLFRYVKIVLIIF